MEDPQVSLHITKTLQLAVPSGSSTISLRCMTLRDGALLPASLLRHEGNAYLPTDLPDFPQSLCKSKIKTTIIIDVINVNTHLPLKQNRRQLPLPQWGQAHPSWW